MKPKTVTVKKAAVLSNNSLKKGIVNNITKVDKYERRRQKRKKGGRQED